MYVIEHDSLLDDVRLIEGTLNGKHFSLVCEEGVWREQTGNFDINDLEFRTFMNIAINE
jgi:hypothetical protein